MINHKQAVNRLTCIELRVGALGVSGGGYPVYNPDTQICDIREEYSDEEWETVRFWKDWRNIHDETCGNWFHPKSNQYPESALLLKGYHPASTLDDIVKLIYEEYGKPKTNHVSSIIVPVKVEPTLPVDANKWLNKGE